MFSKIEKTLYQIKNTLLNSADLKKLLVYNTADALTKAEPSYTDAESSIYIKPIIYVYDDSPEYGISSFISIGMIQAEISKGSVKASIKIGIACNRDITELNGDKTRTLSLLSLVCNQLHNKKFAAAGQLNAGVVQEVYYNNDLTGYAVLFDIDDSEGSIVNEF